MTSFASVEELTGALNRVDYLVDEGLATALYLAQSLGQPLLLEGEPGVGKTAAAKAMAKALNTPLLRFSVTKASLPTKRSMSGTIRVSFWPFGYPRPMVRSWPTPTCLPMSTWSNVHCWLR